MEALQQREIYNRKYTSGEYKNLYGYVDSDGVFSIPVHYFMCADYLKNVLDIDLNSKILEIGCGTGAFLCNLDRVGFKYVRGIDISDKAVELSIMPEVTFQCDASNILWPDNYFDLTVSIGTFEHFTEEILREALKEIMRVSSKAVLWIDKGDNGDHVFNKDPIWWANKIKGIIEVESIVVDRNMEGGSGTNPILINCSNQRGQESNLLLTARKLIKEQTHIKLKGQY